MGLDLYQTLNVVTNFKFTINFVNAKLPLCVSRLRLNKTQS